MSNWVTRRINRGVKEFSDFVTDPTVLTGIGTGIASGMPTALATGGGSLWIGALTGALGAAAARDEKDYARSQDALNRDFAERQFSEAKRQFDVGQSNYENATQIRASDMQKVGMNPLSLGGSAQSQASSSIAGSNVSSGASQMDYMSNIIQAVLGSQSNQIERERIKSDERIARAKMASDERIATGRDTTSENIALMQEQSRKWIAAEHEKAENLRADNSERLQRDLAKQQKDLALKLKQADLDNSYQERLLRDKLTSDSLNSAEKIASFKGRVDGLISDASNNIQLFSALKGLEFQYSKLMSSQKVEAMRQASTQLMQALDMTAKNFGYNSNFLMDYLQWSASQSGSRPIGFGK